MVFEEVRLSPGASQWVDFAVGQLAGRRDALVEDDTVAARVTHAIGRTVPFVYGGGQPGATAASRWKNQINENAKLPAFWGSLPEADHNEVCGWDRAHELGRMHALFLDDPDADERTRARIEPTAKVAQPSTRVDPVGETPTERTLALVLLGDLVSVYLAVLDGVDPTPIEAIERVKADLAAG